MNSIFIIVTKITMHDKSSLGLRESSLLAFFPLQVPKQHPNPFFIFLKFSESSITEGSFGRHDRFFKFLSVQNRSSPSTLDLPAVSGKYKDDSLNSLGKGTKLRPNEQQRALPGYIFHD